MYAMGRCNGWHDHLCADIQYRQCGHWRRHFDQTCRIRNTSSELCVGTARQGGQEAHVANERNPFSPNPGNIGDRRRAPRRQQDRRLLQRERELEAARLICQALSQHINVDELVENALRIALEVVDADAGSVLLADDKTQQLVFRYVIGEKAEQLRGTAIPWDLGVAGAVFKSGEPAIIGNVARDTRHFSGIDDTTGYKTMDMIAIPLKRWEGQPIGLPRILTKRNGQPT